MNESNIKSFSFDDFFIKNSNRSVGFCVGCKMLFVLLYFNILGSLFPLSSFLPLVKNKINSYFGAYPPVRSPEP
jgi:hypothetical protein